MSDSTSPAGFLNTHISQTFGIPADMRAGPQKNAFEIKRLQVCLASDHANADVDDGHRVQRTAPNKTWIKCKACDDPPGHHAASGGRNAGGADAAALGARTHGA